MERRCDECEWWEYHDDADNDRRLGWCFRYPPQCSEIDRDSISMAASWPNTLDIHRCGEFKENTNGKEDNQEEGGEEWTLMQTNGK